MDETLEKTISAQTLGKRGKWRVFSQPHFIYTAVKQFEGHRHKPFLYALRLHLASAPCVIAQTTHTPSSSSLCVLRHRPCFAPCVIAWPASLVSPSGLRALRHPSAIAPCVTVRSPRFPSLLGFSVISHCWAFPLLLLLFASGRQLCKLLCATTTSLSVTEVCALELEQFECKTDPCKQPTKSEKE